MKYDGYRSSDIVPIIKFWSDYREFFLKTDDLQNAILCNHLVSDFTCDYFALLEREEKNV